MNHLRAREQCIDGVGQGKWHFTLKQSDGKTYPIGYCGEEQRNCTHLTEEDAVRCYRKYLCDGAMVSAIALSLCEICQSPATHLVTFRGGAVSYSVCETHRDDASAERLLSGFWECHSS